MDNLLSFAEAAQGFQEVAASHRFCVCRLPPPRCFKFSGTQAAYCEFVLEVFLEQRQSWPQSMVDAGAAGFGGGGGRRSLLDCASLAGGDSAYAIDDVSYTYVVVPLPPAVWAGLLGLGIAAGVSRMRRMA